jgi:hypothetical protein
MSNSAVDIDDSNLDGDAVDPQIEGLQLAEMPRCAESAVWAAALVAIIFVPAALLETATLHAFRPRSFITASLIVGAFSLLVIAGTWIASRDIGLAIRTAAAATFALFWWSYLAVPSAMVASTVPFIPVDVAIVVIATAISYAMLRYGRIWMVSIMLVALFLLVAGIQTVEIRDLRIVAQTSGSIVRSVNPPEQTPNVFVLLLDGYPRSDVLEAVFDTSDAAFVSTMASMGIATNPDSWSNYDRTYASVSSMFSLETMLTEDATANATMAHLRGVSGGDGEFLRAFRDSGYHITFAPSNWYGSRCDSIVDSCVAIGSTRSSMYWLFRGTVLAPIVFSQFRSPWTDVSLGQLDSIAEIHASAIQPGRPSIVFMHVALPHPPTVLDADCGETKTPWQVDFGETQVGFFDWGTPSEFGAQVQCVGSVVGAEVGQILGRDPSAAILVLSDHGTMSLTPPGTLPEDLSAGQTWERLANLRAFGGPPRCNKVLGKVSTVGALRELVRCLLGADIVESPLDGFLAPSDSPTRWDQPAARLLFDELTVGLTDGGNS